MTDGFDAPAPGDAPDETTHVAGDPAGSPAVSAGDAGSRRWRSMWRLHFYAGMFAMPFILLMAVTGLVILYTDPIDHVVHGDLRSVDHVEGQRLSYDAQEQAVESAYPDGAVLDMTPPSGEDDSTRFFVDDGSGSGLHVYVDPYTAEVLGHVKPGNGIIGISNRLHGYLNNDSITIELPAVSALWDDGAVMRDYVVGDLLIEIFGVWTLVLVATGLYLWWPRRSRQSQGSHGARRLLLVRRGVTGRARWRDLHGLGGATLLVFMLITIVSGLGWSTYWADQFGSLANTLTPNSSIDPPASSLGVRGDLDRFGNQIPWASGDFPIPASYAPPVGASSPAPLSLDEVVRIAQDEGMKPGYTIAFPGNTTDEAGNTVYGAFTLSNSWPRATGEARDLFIDQFSGAALAEQTGWGFGTVQYSMDVLVSTHMGTQLGIMSRLFMTALCVLSIWSVISGFVMFWKRRRPGTLGLPRRPVDVRLTRRIGVIAVVTGIVFPQWGVTALLILGLDRFVIRRVRPLRRAFGQA